MSDSTKFDMTCVPMKPALQIAFSTSPSGKATHWKHDKEKNRVILAWNKNAGKDYTTFIVPIGPEDFGLVLHELMDNVFDYGREPSHDGDNKKSFRIYCEDWGHVDHNHYAFAAVEPAWAMYGK